MSKENCCAYCGEEFSSSLDLFNHTEFVCKDGLCNYCGNEFQDPQKFKEHFKKCIKESDDIARRDQESADKIKTYKVIRHYRNHELKRFMKRHLTLKEAQEWCKNLETSSSTCSDETNEREETLKFGPWFDSYEEE